MLYPLVTFQIDYTCGEDLSSELTSDLGNYEKHEKKDGLFLKGYLL